MDFNKGIEEFDLVVLDIETTGLSVIAGDAICEIAAHKVRERKVIDTFYSLINPRRTIPNEVYRIHNISDEEVKNAPYFGDIALALNNFLQGTVVCAYNAKFDMGFIRRELEKVHQPLGDLPTIDILRMAKQTLFLPRNNLEAIAKFLKIECSGKLHRAWEDARVAVSVLLKLIDIVKEKGVNSLGDFISWYGIKDGVLRFESQKRESC